MPEIIVIDRVTKKRMIEKVYCANMLRLLYGEGGAWGRLFRFLFLTPSAKWPWVSAFYGYLQKRKSTIRKIEPFIKNFEVDSSEFRNPLSSFRSFNDFFIRKLKPEVRPIAPRDDVAIIPADARYYFYQDIALAEGFVVKGEKFSLKELLGSSSLAEEFEGGSMAIARLCPSDYHRFHFPCECVPGPSRLINGWLYSVNPLAVKRNLQTFVQNKRAVCELKTKAFGRVLFIEIGATNVGSIVETYIPGISQQKGDEKGYFEFGASALILLFAKGTIVFDDDLIAATVEGLEVRCLFGQSMGQASA